MAKIVKLFLIILFTLSLSAAEFDRAFSNFDKSFSNASSINKKKFHNELKDIYLQTSVSKNRVDRIEVLERLVHSSKALGYNHKGYENELNALGGSYKKYLNSLNSTKQNDKNAQLLANVPKKLEQKELAKANKSVEKKQEPIKQEIQKNKPKVEPTKAVKTQASKKQSNSVKTQEKKQTKTIDKSQKLKLLSVEKSSDGIVLKFNREVSKDEQKLFALKGELYRNVLDFKAINSAKTGKLTNHIVDEIRIAQFSETTTRVVFSQKKKFDLKLTNDENELNIAIKGGENRAQAISKTAKTSGKNEKPNYAKNRIIVIDPGHGGKDPGAMGNGLREKDIVLSIGKSLGVILKERGYKIYFTRSTDTFINLKNRTSYANKKNADMFISIHVNAGPDSKEGERLAGIETFFLSPARSNRSKNAAALENKGDLEDMNHFSQQTFLNFLNREKIIASNKLAIDIQKHMLNRVQDKYKVKDGGVREAPFWVLVGATMPAILVESGYISNPNDSKNLAKKSYHNDIALGIANGLDAYFAKNN
ncbi:N-acetylmuramoyl-L-alanine amidase family protein [Campylobacter geochelonis]|uniref:N-acetylmuramoyl-L-alanine amidase family protein n=1 Tax=Campylobacter geochelonis TaxID=1780362 RepID=UPI000770B070|nr:N-acetylmuramoyl-L-alanine amidase [Campylobacter geochelonis]CZE51309.1 N-acetylmuramoyl-L-alanine amidase domain-containing protein [Campylobacter geochelonis]